MSTILTSQADSQRTHCVEAVGATSGRLQGSRDGATTTHEDIVVWVTVRRSCTTAVTSVPGSSQRASLSAFTKQTASSVKHHTRILPWTYHTVRFVDGLPFWECFKLRLTLQREVARFWTGHHHFLPVISNFPCICHVILFYSISAVDTVTSCSTLRVFEKGVLQGILGPKREEVTGG